MGVTMKREIAERFAATALSTPLTVADAQAVIREFLRQLVRCPVCDGSGEYQFGREVVVDVVDRRGNQQTTIPAGTEASCPRCGAWRDEDSGIGDPEFVVWHCIAGDTARDCRHSKSGDHNGRRATHENCGWRIILALPKDG